MKNVLRVVALGFVVSAAMLSNAHAGACQVRCNDGRVWNGSISPGSACCIKIVTFCGGQGGATFNGITCDPDYWNNQ